MITLKRFGRSSYGLLTVLSWHLPEETEASHETLSAEQMSRPRFKPRTSQE
jgi:hypothetical protein